MDWKHLEQIRRAEAELALAELRRRKPPRASLIEIGGGSGWQAQEFAQVGYDVASFDLASSEYAGRRAYPVQDYDGHHLPVESACADIVFSSNVPRAYRPCAGLPNRAAARPQTRWYRPAYLADAQLAAVDLGDTLPLGGQEVGRPADGRKGRSATIPCGNPSPKPGQQNASLGQTIRNALYPARHGEIGNSVTELYYFSRHRWTRLFEATGWRIDHYGTNGLAYTGHSLAGGALGLPPVAG